MGMPETNTSKNVINKGLIIVIMPKGIERAISHIPYQIRISPK